MSFSLSPQTELKDEKDGVKSEDSAKLQNGENAKETSGGVDGVSEEKKKAVKQRFMFNIADGGFTGTLGIYCLCVCVHAGEF